MDPANCLAPISAVGASAVARGLSSEVESGVDGVHEVLDGDGVGQQASGDLDPEEGRDLALLGHVDRLGAREGEVIVLRACNRSL